MLLDLAGILLRLKRGASAWRWGLHAYLAPLNVMLTWSHYRAIRES